MENKWTFWIQKYQNTNEETCGCVAYYSLLVAIIPFEFIIYLADSEIWTAKVSLESLDSTKNSQWVPFDVF